MNVIFFLSNRIIMPRVSLNQKKILVDHVFDNFYVLLGTFQSSSGNKYKTNKWNEIANVLNQIGPSTKSGAEWKKTFATIKSQTKEKVGNMRRKWNQGKSSEIKFSNIDEKIIQMFGVNHLDGLNNVNELGIRSRKSTPVSFLETFPKYGLAVLHRKKKTERAKKTNLKAFAKQIKSHDTYLYEIPDRKSEIVGILQDINILVKNFDQH